MNRHVNLLLILKIILIVKYILKILNNIINLLIIDKKYHLWWNIINIIKIFLEFL